MVKVLSVTLAGEVSTHNKGLQLYSMVDYVLVLVVIVMSCLLAIARANPGLL